MTELINLLRKHNIKISTAESCTGGLISGEITSVSGASEFFEMGVVTYSNAAKMKLINVKEETLKQYGAVSQQTALEMSAGVRKLSDADLSVAVTGIAGPTGYSKEKPVGLVYISTSGKYENTVKQFNFTGDRDAIRMQTVAQAIQMLKEYIVKFYS